MAHFYGLTTKQCITSLRRAWHCCCCVLGQSVSWTMYTFRVLWELIQMLLEEISVYEGLNVEGCSIQYVM